MKLRLIPLLAVFCAAPAWGASRFVASLPMQVENAKGKVTPEARIALEELLRDEAAAALGPKGFVVLSDENLRRIAEDNGLDLSLPCSAGCQLDLGREVRAELLVASSLLWDDELVLTVRLLEVSSGRQLASRRIEGASSKDVRKALPPKLKGFFDVVGAPPAPPRPQDGTVDLATAEELAKKAVKPAEKRMLVVLPFHRLEDAPEAQALQPLEETLRGEAARTLAGDGIVTLTSESMLQILEDNGIDPAMAAEAQNALDAARELRASLLVTGTSAKVGTTLVAMVRAIDVRSAQTLATVRVEGKDAKTLSREVVKKWTVLQDAIRRPRAGDAKRRLVMVLPLDAKGIASSENALLADVVRAEAGRALGDGFLVLTNDTTLTILAENGVDPNKACEASSALETAQMVNAELFVNGTVVKADGELLAFVRLFESRSGKQLASVKCDGPDPLALVRACEAKVAEGFAKAKAP